MALGLEDDLNGESLVGPLWTITCNDAVTHPDATGDGGAGPIAGGADPLGGAEAVANYLIACPGWTGSSEPIAHLAPNGAPTPL